MTIAEVMGSTAAPGPKTRMLLVMAPSAKMAKAAKIETLLVSFSMSRMVPRQLLENAGAVSWSAEAWLNAVAGAAGFAECGQWGFKLTGRAGGPAFTLCQPSETLAPERPGRYIGCVWAAIDIVEVVRAGRPWV